MEADQRFAPRNQVLSLEEIARVARTFVDLGVRKIRLTGGEPLVRRNLSWLMREIAALPGLDELVITTNGSQLEAQAREIRSRGRQAHQHQPGQPAAGAIPPHHPQRRSLAVLRGSTPPSTPASSASSSTPSSSSTATTTRSWTWSVRRGQGHQHQLHRGDARGPDRGPRPGGGLLLQRPHPADLETRFELVPTTETTGGPARYYRIPETETRVGFISPHSHNFCGDCNRVRVTTEGRLLLCLGQEHSLDLRRILREHPGDGRTGPAIRMPCRSSPKATSSAWGPSPSCSAT